MDYSPITDRLATKCDVGLVYLKNMQDFSRMDGFADYKDLKVEGPNPCCEQSLESYELCCLVETFPEAHESYEDYQRTLKFAYLYAKTVTLLPTHWAETNEVMMRNRRIGASQSGIQKAFIKHGRRTLLNWCYAGYTYLTRLDEIYSNWLCIPRSIKMTSVKPSGTVSLLAGQTPGIHYPISRFYIRRVRVSATSPLIPLLVTAGIHVEQDVRDPSAMVASFPTDEGAGIRGEKEVSVWEQVSNVAAYQKYWSDNQVSVTLKFHKHEIKDLPRLLECFEDQVKGLAFLPQDGDDNVWPQMPLEAITEEQYNEMKSNITDADFSSFGEVGVGEKFCDGDSCTLK
jgi:hypothetical protein